MIARLFPFIALLLTASVLATAADDRKRARELRMRGEIVAAFKLFAALPFAEQEAVTTAIPDPTACLKALTKLEIPKARAALLRGELHRILKDPKTALRHYREAARLWDSDDYPVEKPAQTWHEARPFSLGPGSHRDNLLIRRFIALDALDDAEAEFIRILKLHEKRRQPHVVRNLQMGPSGQLETKRQSFTLYDAGGRKGDELQCVLDLAFFYKRRQQADKALKLLLAVVLEIDLDFNPNISRAGRKISAEQAKAFPGPKAGPFLLTAGRHAHRISRKEFLRLSYGTFKDAKQVDVLVAALRKNAENGEHPALRTLARIRMLEARFDAALALEKKYIKTADFNALSIAYREGRLYEGLQKVNAAIAAYERFRKLPDEPIQIPDPEERGPVSARQQRYSALSFSGFYGVSSATMLREEVHDRLKRLYMGQGLSNKVFELTLEEYTAKPKELARPQNLADMRRNFAAVDRQVEFLPWIRSIAPRISDEGWRANVYWEIGDPDKTLALLVNKEKKQAVDASPLYSVPSYDTWHKRFKTLGTEGYLKFLRAMAEASPHDIWLELMRLEAEGGLASDAGLAALERVLDPMTKRKFPSHLRGSPTHTAFSDVNAVAYRLMGLYEARGRQADMVRLGFRILRGEAPFDRKFPISTPRANWHRPEPNEAVLECIYRMLPYVKEKRERATLQALVKNLDCLPLRNQVARLIGGPDAPRLSADHRLRRAYERVEVKTVGLPAGARLWTNRDDVWAVTADGRWTGTSWGLVRSTERKDGSLEILQFPIGSRVSQFLQTEHGLFVGTDRDLYRIDNANGAAPKVVRIDLDTAWKDKRRRRAWYPMHLIEHDGYLWVQRETAVVRYAPGLRQVYAAGRVEGKLFVAAGRLWGGQSVYNPESETFDRLKPPTAVKITQWKFIGSAAGKIWADAVMPPPARHRPARFDPATNTLHVLPFHSRTRQGKPMKVYRSWNLLRTTKNKVWFSASNTILASAAPDADRAQYVVADAKPMAAADVEESFWTTQGASLYRYSVGGGRASIQTVLKLDGDRESVLSYQMQEDGILLASGVQREWWVDNLGYDDNSGISHHIQDLEGGLFRIWSDGSQWTLLGSSTGQLTDFYVKRLVFDDENKVVYVCTNGGVSVLSMDGSRLLRRITVMDGLPSNKVEDVVRIGHKLYFACELGDDRGGLAIQDLKTGLISHRLVADGLGCDKVKRLRAEGDMLHIIHGWMYGVRSRQQGDPKAVHLKKDKRVITFHSRILDTRSGRITLGKELPEQLRWLDGKPLPWLGGIVLVDQVHNGRRWLGGTHGLIILPSAKTELTTPQRVQTPKLVRSQEQAFIEEASSYPLRIESPADLKKELKHHNPKIRVRALKAAAYRAAGDTRAWLKVVGPSFNDARNDVRQAAWMFAAQHGNKVEAPALRAALKDGNVKVVRAAATALARIGQPASMTVYHQVLSERNRNYYTDCLDIYRFLGRDPTEEVVNLFLDFPLPTDNYQPRWDVLRSIGRNLHRHPNAVRPLLSAHEREVHSHSKVKFAQALLSTLDASLWPTIRKALRSKDRIIRSNAARACTSFRGNREVVPALLAALDLESGLSRASVVWALGELKAVAATERLAELYVDACNDDTRRRAGGFRYAQALAVMQDQYSSLSSLDAIGADYAGLCFTLSDPPLDPRSQEELISPEGILAAMRKIGAEHAQAFYRSLAASSKANARSEAAAALGIAGHPDNLPLLRSLLADRNAAVRLPAAVSLMILGKVNGVPELQSRLAESNQYSLGQTIVQLERVGNGSGLAPLAERLEALSKDANLSPALRRRLAALAKRARQ